MNCRFLIGALALTTALVAFADGSAAQDANYPDWRGMWSRIGGAGWDPNKPNGLPQKPPLTAEARALWLANMADQESGGQDYNPQVRCLPGGMPRMMIVYEPGMEILVAPKKTVIYISFNSYFRQIHTDGRDWPSHITPTFSGYSIGRWIDANGDGRSSVLEVETRGIKGPRLFESSGIPLHRDNETIVKERISLDRSNPNILHDEITTFDHSLVRPWTVTRSYSRDRNAPWVEHFCAENNEYVFLRNQTYVMSADGLLMPSKKDQPPPDLRKFK
ncbi:MAG TPA: hypothetical protein VH684_16915 [Xanthobacteraceae bacterium]|jgi:hypothetical protein